MKRWLIAGMFLLMVVAYLSWAMLRPLPALEPYIVFTPKLAFTPKQQVYLSGVGSQALAVGNNGQIITNNANVVRPTASTAKIMLALLILNKYPLTAGQTGPIIPITVNDEKMQQQMANNGQSTMLVQTGTNLNEYQALQALLIASANNIANKLAIWGFGSEAEYAKQANEYAKNIGMAQTNFADSSGFSPNTRGTASDMLTLSQKAMENDVVAQIVSQKYADLPIAGRVQNTNTSLGIVGIDGIKTGYTIEAGGCLLYSAKNIIPIIGTIMGAPNKELALEEAPANVEIITSKITHVNTIYKGQPIGYYKLPWGNNINVIASDTLSISAWKGESPKTDIKLDTFTLNSQFNGQAISTSSIQKKAEIQLKLSGKISNPSILWRITHPV